MGHNCVGKHISRMRPGLQATAPPPNTHTTHAHTPHHPPCAAYAPPGCSNVEGMFVHVVFDAMTRGYESQHNKWGMIGEPAPGWAKHPLRNVR